MQGEVVAIHIAPEAAVAMQAVDEVEAVTEQGLVGDRYHKGIGTYSHIPKPRGVTLIEEESLAAVEDEGDLKLAASESRRNILTRGVRLNDLVGKEFYVGGVLLRGFELSEPCEHLQQVTGKPVIKPFVHRCGLRAGIVSGGTIRVGDAIITP